MGTAGMGYWILPHPTLLPFEFLQKAKRCTMTKRFLLLVFMGIFLLSCDGLERENANLGSGFSFMNTIRSYSVSEESIIDEMEFVLALLI